MTTNDSLRLAELLKTPICKMDGEELAFLITSVTTGAQSQLPINQPKERGTHRLWHCRYCPDIRLQHSDGQPY